MGKALQPEESVGVSVGRDDLRSSSSGRERRESSARAHVDQPGAASDRREREEKPSVLTRRVDRDLLLELLRPAGDQGPRQRLLAMASYWLHAYYAT
jgi:hypothetical protein